MLKAAIKFCGGCNPRYERGEAYSVIREAVEQDVTFSLPQDGVHYDILLIIRGCTACPYLYEDIEAEHRLICTDQSEISEVISEIKRIHANIRTSQVDT